MLMIGFPPVFQIPSSANLLEISDSDSPGPRELIYHFFMANEQKESKFDDSFSENDPQTKEKEDTITIKTAKDKLDKWISDPV